LEIVKKTEQIDKSLKTKEKEIFEIQKCITKIENIEEELKKKAQQMYSPIQFAQLLREELNESTVTTYLKNNFADNEITFDDVKKVCDFVGKDFKLIFKSE